MTQETKYSEGIHYLSTEEAKLLNYAPTILEALKDGANHISEFCDSIWLDNPPPESKSVLQKMREVITKAEGL